MQLDTYRARRAIPVRSLLATVAGLLIACALAAPGAADAATFCVNKPACVGEAKPTPQEALDAAALNNAADTVYIGAKSSPYTGGLSYVDSEQITIVGDGASSTVVEATTAAPAILLGNSHSRIEDLKIVHASDRGLLLGGAADDVTVNYTGNDVDTTGVLMVPGGYLAGATVSTLGTAVIAGGSGASTVRDSFLSGRVGAGTGTTASTLNASRLTVWASQRGVSTEGHVSLSNSVIALQAGAEYGVMAGSDADVVAKHLTVVGPWSARGIALLDTGGATPANVHLDSSIIHGFATPWGYFDGHSDLIVRYSAFSTNYWVERGPGTLDTSVGNVDVVPEFVPSGGFFPSYRLLYPSPLIDAGDPADTLTEDRAGQDREVDGDGVNGPRSDIGAFEYQRKPPVAAFTAPTSLAPGAIGLFSSAPSSDPDPGDKAGFKYSWSFGDGALSAAVSPAHAYATAGVYDVTLKVTDPSGLSDSHTVQVNVAAPGQPDDPQPPQDPQSPVDPQSPQDPQIPVGPQTPQGDVVAPLISDVAIKGRAQRRIVRFRLSEDAAVSLRFKRKGARRVRRLAVRGKAGVNRVRFLRRLELRAGSYGIAIHATDVAGNATTKKAAARFVLRRGA